MAKTDLTSIIIVNWNTKELTAKCLQSIFDRISSNIEILLVDNASSDGSVEYLRQRFPDVTYIVNEENVGYARANNQAMKRARGDVFILLNSDTEILSPEPVEKIRTFFSQSPNVGIVGAKLYGSNGRILSLGREFMTVRSLVKSQIFFNNSPFFRKRIPISRQTVDYVDGAFLVIRRQVVDQIGFLNERYFMYAEDMEWCADAQDAGWRIAVLPDIEVLHHHAQSSKKVLRRILIHNALNISRFIAKRQGFAEAKRAFGVLAAGLFLRSIISLFRKSTSAGDYWRAFVGCLKMSKELKVLLSD
jgi:GT2 family glycosyltransferase